MDEEDLPAELLAQPVRGEVALPTRQLAVVDHQPGRLVDDGKEFVAVKDAQLLPPPLRRQGRAGAGVFQRRGHAAATAHRPPRSEEHTSELQSLMRSPYAVFVLKKKNKHKPRARLTS